jgi:hypothetical protein
MKCCIVTNYVCTFLIKITIVKALWFMPVTVLMAIRMTEVGVETFSLILKK